MESNEKYRVCCIVDNTQPEIKAMQEKDMKKTAIMRIGRSAMQRGRGND